MTDAGWTREKPKVAGWYWWRFRDGKDPVVMKIGDDHIAKTNVFTMGTSVLLIDELPGEWLGPISPDTYHQGRVAGLMEAAIICRERGKPHDIEWWNTVSKKEISRQTAIDCAELIEQQAQGGEAK